MSRPNSRPEARPGHLRGQPQPSPAGRQAAPASSSRYSSGAVLLWVRLNATGRPVASATLRSSASSPGNAASFSPATPDGEHFEHAGAELGERPADADEFVFGGEGARHRFAVERLVQHRA